MSWLGCLTKNLIALENELDAPWDKDRVLFIKGLINEGKSATATTDTKSWTQLHDLEKALNTKNMQQVRKIRKALLDTLNYDPDHRADKHGSTKKIFCARAFNRSNTKKYPMKDILDPLFNVCEILKQAYLLEQHLSDRKMRCPTCIRKHSVFMEGLADEANMCLRKDILSMDALAGEAIALIMPQEKTKLEEPLRKLRRQVIETRKMFHLDGPKHYDEMIKATQKIIRMCNYILDNLADAKRRKRILCDND
jgi:hypothetical protein